MNPRQMANLQKGGDTNNGYSPTKVSSELTKSLEKVHINGDDDFRDDGRETPPTYETVDSE